MRLRRTWLAMLAVVLLGTACATVAGGMIGGGIGKATGGDGEAGAMIGAGIGMMVDVMD
ncbi:MAG: hypothetical protein R3266_15140 [Gemmatimonadota bacterium]|nr:hypothetical protein [Gemmatimonadota bacterium]